MTGPLSLFCSMATFYLAGALAYCGYVATERGVLLILGKGLWMSGFSLHSLFLMVSLLQRGRLPTVGVFEASLFFAWAVAVTAYLSAWYYRIRTLGAFVLPLVFFLIVLASLHVHQRIFTPASFSRMYFGLHTLFIFWGYAGFALAGVTALMYLVLERQIKQKQTGRFYRRLPSLELLEEANRRFVMLGLLLYSLGIVFGLLWSRVALGYWVGKDLKVFFAFVTWLLYGSLFWRRQLGHSYGRGVMILSVFYFFWVIGTFIGIQHPTMFTVFH